MYILMLILGLQLVPKEAANPLVAEVLPEEINQLEEVAALHALFPPMYGHAHTASRVLNTTVERIILNHQGAGELQIRDKCTKNHF